MTLFFTFTFTLFQCLPRQNQPKKKLRSSSNADSRGIAPTMAGTSKEGKLGLTRANETSELLSVVWNL